MDNSHLARLLSDLGAPDDLVARAGPDASAGAILADSRRAGIAIGDAVARQALRFASGIAGDGVRLDVVVVDRAGELVGRAGP